MVAVEKEVEIEMAEVAAPVEDAQKEFENFVAKQDQEKSFTLDDFAALDKDELCCEMVEGEHLAAPGQEGMDCLGKGPVRVEQRVMRKNLCKVIIESLSGCELNNIYDVYPPGQSNMVLKEKTNCMMRQCCGKHRTFEVHLQTSDDASEPVYKGVKNGLSFPDCCPLQFLPPCRPQMDVYNAKGQNVGRVYDPFACCNINNDIYDAKENHLYHIEASCCQIGICCPICFDIDFPIKSKQSDATGMFKKKAGGLMELICGQLATKFEIDFPADCDTEEKKAMLVMSSFLIDLNYFEKSD